MAQSHEERFRQLGLELPPAPKAIGVYRPAVIVGNLLMSSGHGPLLPDGSLIKGVVGREATRDQGYAAARQTGLALLATIRNELGTLDRVRRLVKTFGMVQCTAEFDQHPAVINGCSELFAQVFGETAGIGARSAVGMNSLPLGMMVEIEVIVELV